MKGEVVRKSTEKLKLKYSVVKNIQLTQKKEGNEEQKNKKGNDKNSKMTDLNTYRDMINDIKESKLNTLLRRQRL